MQEITKKLRDDALKSFMPAIEQLAKEGATKAQIVDAYKKYQDSKIKQLYAKEPFTKIGNVLKSLSLDNPDSHAEHIFFNMLLNNGIKCKFHYKIGPYEADYLLNDDIVLELDGPMHGTKKDERKDKYLRRMGYKVVRIPIWVLANDPKAVISAIQEL